jgi:dihydropteroate synthase-like protein
MSELQGQRIHFITGKLAEESLRSTVAALAKQLDFTPSIEVLPITVAALMTADWIVKKWQPPADANRIVLPGYCAGNTQALSEAAGVPCELGPRDLRSLPAYLGGSPMPTDYGHYNIEIIAEINHAPQLTLDELTRQAQLLAVDGADVIDLGCIPGSVWKDIGQATRALRDLGLRVSVDSFTPREVELACAAGAELVLSVNESNVAHVTDWDTEVVVIPNTPADVDSLDRSIAHLQNQGAPFRIDPIIQPIGCGFANSLARYWDVRRRYPDKPMMMGIGNLTELTDCDSAGLNMMLIAFCQELSIRSVLTTQVINWARSSVRECDVARRLSYYAVQHKSVPKHVDDRLIMLRDVSVLDQQSEALERLADQIRDRNYRIFAERGEIHLISRQFHECDKDPFVLFQRVLQQRPESVDPSHAFYLGYEMAKAATALTLNKRYRQDESLDWGLLTILEDSQRLQRTVQARGEQHEG